VTAPFSEYIKDPKAKIPGTKMIYAGLKDEQKVTDLLAFLKQMERRSEREHGSLTRRDLHEARR